MNDLTRRLRYDLWLGNKLRMEIADHIDELRSEIAVLRAKIEHQEIVNEDKEKRINRQSDQITNQANTLNLIRRVLSGGI